MCVIDKDQHLRSVRTGKAVFCQVHRRCQCTRKLATVVSPWITASLRDPPAKTQQTTPSCALPNQLASVNTGHSISPSLYPCLCVCPLFPGHCCQVSRSCFCLTLYHNNGGVTNATACRFCLCNSPKLCFLSFQKPCPLL